MAMEFPKRLEIYKAALELIAQREPINYWPTALIFQNMERNGWEKLGQVEAEFTELCQIIWEFAQDYEVDARMKAEEN